DAVKRSPPCTIRCPIAAIFSFKDGSNGKICFTIKSSASLCAAPAPNSAFPFSPCNFHLIRASGKWNASARPDNFSSPLSGFKITNFNDELPQLRIRIRFCVIEITYLVELRVICLNKQDDKFCGDRIHCYAQKINFKANKSKIFLIFQKKCNLFGSDWLKK